MKKSSVPHGAVRRCRAAVAGLLLLGAAAYPVLAADSKASRFYEDALVRYEKRDIAGTILQLKNALQADRNMLPAHVLLGKVLLQNGEVGAAEVAFNEALRLGVNRAEVVLPMARALVLQGKQQMVIEDVRFQTAGLSALTQSDLLLVKAGAQADLGDPRAALKSIEDARALNPDAVEGWLAEVPVRIRLRQFKEADLAVAKALALDAKSADAHYQGGSVAHVRGDLKSALAAYDRSLALQADHIDARLSRAGLLIDLKRPADAARDVTELLRLRATEPRGWYLSALLAEREGRQEQVRKSMVRITELLDPVPIEYIRLRPQTLLLAGQAHYGLGQIEKAKPYFDTFERLQPGTPVSKLIANIHLTQQNYDRAIESLEAYLRGYPSDTQAMALLASAHMAKGRNARAASLMQEALRTRDAPELYTAYGLSLVGVGQAASGMSQLETAYKKDPKQVQAGFALVALYLRNDQVAKAMAISSSLVAGQPQNPSFHNQLGMVKAQARDLPGARASFEQALKLDPTLTQATLNLARLETAAKQFDRARALLDGVLKADERGTEAMYEYAVLSGRLNQPAESLRWLQRAYDIAGAKDLRSSLALVSLHLTQGRRADALKVAQQVSAALPDDLTVLMALVRAQLANGDTAGAKTSLTTATRLANFDAPSQVEVALLQLTINNVQGAAYSLEKALSTRPDFLPALAAMTDVEVRQGELGKAEARAQAILKREPKLPLGHSLLGDIALARKQPAQAIEHYRRAHAVGQSAQTFAALFGAQAAQDAKAGIALADQWLKQRPNDIGARKMLAQAHVRLGDMHKARGEYERLRTLVPADPAVLNDLANVLIRLKDPSALQVAEQALQANPGNPGAIDTVGWAAFQAGNLDRALQTLRDARLRDPDSPEIRYHLAAVLVKSGRSMEARDELHAALRGRAPFEGRSDAEALFRTLR